MTAQPEKVDVDRVLEQTPPSRANPSVQTLPPAPIAATAVGGICGCDTPPPRWRVVAADGSTRIFDLAIFDLAPSTDRARSHQPVGKAKTPIRPQLSEMLEARVEQSSPGGDQPSRIGDARKLDATTALEIGGKFGPGRTRRSEAVAATPGRGLGQFVMPPQAAVPRQDIDSQLARIIHLWAQLPRGIQAAVLAMVEAAREHR